MPHSPVIGVAWPKADYVAALERAGAVVRTLDPHTDVVPGVLDECDGVLLTGGEDVDPLLYGDAERHPTVEVAPERDAYEIALTREALERDLPLLAICRGAQVLNVAAGGSLVQDIPTAVDSTLTHSVDLPKDALVHEVDIASGTCLSVLVTGASGGGHIAVNSRHHQSVKAAAPGFVVSASAPDGIVEAIERPEARFCLGVQWHPENFWRDGRFGSLFEGFVTAAGQYHQAKTP